MESKEIKSEELRVGNYVRLGESYQIVDAVQFEARKGDRCVHLAGNLIWNSLRLIKPILLSPELLVKIGFEVRKPDSEMVFSWRHESNIILNQSKIEASYFFLYPALWQPNAHITSLHQLQNIIFALTNKELNIQL